MILREPQDDASAGSVQTIAQCDIGPSTANFVRLRLSKPIVNDPSRTSG